MWGAAGNTASSPTRRSTSREQQRALARIAAADLDYKLGMHSSVLARAARQIDAQTFADPAAQRRFFADSGLSPMFDGASLPPWTEPLSPSTRPTAIA